MTADFPVFVAAGDQPRVAGAAVVAKLFTGLEGRLEFTLADMRAAQGGASAAATRYATLRLDPERELLSGDLFQDAHAGRKWLLSWRSEAIYELGQGGFLACCELAVPQTTPPGRHAKLYLKADLAPGGPGRIAVREFRMVVVDGRVILHDYRMPGPGGRGRHSRNFRALRLGIEIDAQLRHDPVYGDAMARAFGVGGSLLRRLADERFDVEVTYEEGGARGTAAAGRDPLAGFLGRIAAIGDRDPSAFHLFVSNLDDEEAGEDIPLGRAFGIDRGPRRVAARRAAAIFPREIGKAVTQLGRAADTDELEFRLVFATIHELAHLLNLPHPWQRDAFADMRMTAEPQALSWTNYGSLYPLGLANAFAFELLTDDREAERLRYSNESFRTFRERVAFTAQERRHLYHAPFDRIAPGEQSFADGERRALAVARPASPRPRLTLEVDGALEEDGARVVRPRFYGGLSRQASYQPVTGLVRFVPRDPPTDPRPRFLFRFGSDALHLMWRAEFESKWSDRAPRTVAAYRPGPAVAAGRMMRPSPNLGLVRTDRGPGFVAPLPLVLPSFFSAELGGAREFTLQAVLVELDGTVHHSNTVRVIFEPHDDPVPFGSATRAVQTLLAWDLLPAVADGALYHEKRAVRDAGGPGDWLDDPQVAAQSEALADLAWLRLLRLVRAVRRTFDAAHHGEDLTEAAPDLSGLPASGPILLDVQISHLTRAAQAAGIRGSAERLSTNLPGWLGERVRVITHERGQDDLMTQEDEQ